MLPFPDLKRRCLLFQEKIANKFWLCVINENKTLAWERYFSEEKKGVSYTVRQMEILQGGAVALLIKRIQGGSVKELPNYYLLTFRKEGDIVYQLGLKSALIQDVMITRAAGSTGFWVSSGRLGETDFQPALLKEWPDSILQNLTTQASSELNPYPRQLPHLHLQQFLFSGKDLTLLFEQLYQSEWEIQFADGSALESREYWFGDWVFSHLSGAGKPKWIRRIPTRQNERAPEPAYASGLVVPKAEPYGLFFLEDERNLRRPQADHFRYPLQPERGLLSLSLPKEGSDSFTGPVWYPVSGSFIPYFSKSSWQNSRKLLIYEQGKGKFRMVSVFMH